MNTPKKYTYDFICPECHKHFRMDEPGEPCCTGPSETRDDHPMTVMHLHKVEEREVNPVMGQRRAEGQLIMPWMDEEIQTEARKLLLP